MQRDVFISYSRKNFDTVENIKKQIDDATGVECWMDLKGGIETGSKRYDDDIIEGINKSSVFLFMLSAESQQSDNAIGELDLANAKKKRVVIVNIDNCQLTDRFILHYGRADIIYWQNSLQRKKLLRDVARWVSSSQSIKEPLQEIEERIARLDKKVGELKLVHWIDWDDNEEGYQFEDASGSIVFDGRYWSYADEFHEGLAVVDAVYWPVGEEDDENDYWGGPGVDIKYGYIDKSGHVVIPCQWADARRFSEGFAAVEDSSGKFGYIDKSGRVVIPCQWVDAEIFSKGLARVKDSSGKWWKIDKSGKVVSEA